MSSSGDDAMFTELPDALCGPPPPRGDRRPCRASTALADDGSKKVCGHPWSHSIFDYDPETRLRLLKPFRGGLGVAPPPRDDVQRFCSALL